MRVLLVDDDALVREALRLLLEDAGYLVVEACDGKEALRTFRRAPIDLILCDLFMPELDGLELIRALSREDPGVRIIAMSGRGCVGTVDLLQIAHYLGAAGVLPKPFDRKMLLAMIHRVFQGTASGVFSTRSTIRPTARGPARPFR